MYSVKQVKPGLAILIDGEPYLVVKAVFSKQARQGGNNKTQIRNLKTGAIKQHTFSGNDRVEPADLARTKCQFLYDDGSAAHFMHNETYEQFEISHEMLDDQRFYLVEGGVADILFFEDAPIGVQVPAKVELKVIETPPGVKGDTATGGSKPAKLETGITIQVPLFINEGDTIRVNSDEGTYVERVS